jgi:hypothetical protein
MVRWMMVPFTFVLCLFLVTEGTSGDKKKVTIAGAVIAVEAAKDSKDTGTITVKTPEKKKKDVVVAEAKEHKIEVTKDTKIEKAAEKKKDPPTAGTFADLQKDQAVTVTHTDGKAEKIVIAFKKK